jgi:hypothetical protein
MRQIDIAYAAGFFDGEGHISIRKHTRDASLNFRVSASQNDPQPLYWLQTLFGGNIYRQHSRKKSYAYVWVVSGEQAYKFLEAVLPFLMVKDAEAKEACERWINRAL